MKGTGHPGRWAAGAGALLLAGAGVLTLQPHPSSAAVGIKNTGPVMTLSNGRQVQILTAISDSQSNVTEIDYTIHGPAGTTMTKVSYQKAWPNLLNRAVYVADQASGTYKTTALVKSKATTAAAVSAQSSVTYGKTKHSASASGKEGATVASALTG